MPRPTVTVKVDDRELVRLMRKSKGKAPKRIVADGVHYGIYQEFGHHGVAARPCAKPAAEEVRPSFHKAMAEALTIEQAEQVTEKAARDVERLWKQNIVTKDVIDTGAYLNSIHVVRGAEHTYEVSG
jgi:hypothetical protein